MTEFSLGLSGIGMIRMKTDSGDCDGVSCLRGAHVPMAHRRLAILTTILLLAAIPLLAAPNFSGTWKLNTAKSDFGQMPAPDSMTRTIKHDEPTLKIHTKQSGQMGEMEMDSTYTTDGKESSNQMMGNEVKSTAKWDGDTLVIDSKGKFGDNDFTMNQKWVLAADGKTMTVTQKFSSSMGEGEAKLLLEKQ